MLRVLLATVLCSGLALSSVSTAGAIDYPDPVVPPEFLLGGQAAPAPADDGGARLLAQGVQPAPAAVPLPNASRGDADPPEAGSAGASWPRDGAAGALHVVVNSQWTDGGGGCALWDWTSC
jgi:hypothetical protein